MNKSNPGTSTSPDQIENLIATVSKNTLNINMLNNKIKQLEDIIYQMLKNPDKANLMKNTQLARLETTKAFPIVYGGGRRRTRRRTTRNQDSKN